MLLHRESDMARAGSSTGGRRMNPLDALPAASG